VVWMRFCPLRIKEVAEERFFALELLLEEPSTCTCCQFGIFKHFQGNLDQPSLKIMQNNTISSLFGFYFYMLASFFVSIVTSQTTAGHCIGNGIKY